VVDVDVVVVGPLPDDTLITRGLWQYARHYDPAGPEPE
jgi:hypothetical protein